MTRRALILGVLAPAMAACAVKVRPSSLHGQHVQRGLASWYGHGDGYDGRRTASGQRFDKNGLTAAHFDLPFGTRIRVRNLRNGRHVDLTITDRFPVETLAKGRILDVSYGAARKLRMIEDGVVPVELTVRA
ncbi:MAG: septal ring lytic transglycosylase RlpA family protein [Acidobacteria bacterium]|nr:MAG: septal ring lytic transglycosylase RlpA family protein [Acidobacteriota bacterium]